MKKQQKNMIEQLFQDKNIEKLSEILENYRKDYPSDRDLWFYDCVFYLINEDYENAQYIADKCTQKFPTSYEAYYYQASVFQARNMIQEALKSYKISYILFSYFKYEKNDIIDDIVQQLKLLTEQFSNLTEIYNNNNDINNIRKVQSYIAREKSIWGKFETAPRNENENIIGKKCWVSDEEVRYVGIYRSPIQDLIGKENLNLIRTQAEFLKFSEGTNVQVNGNAEEYLLPIASENDGNILAFFEDEKEYDIEQHSSKHFNYYRVKNNTIVHAKNLAYFGYPIPLKHNKNRKKLVLSFFVDGLSQEIINGSDFEKLMPHTYHFFKKGTICTNAYSCAEWTLPSLASYETGLHTLNHMLFHNTVDGELPHNVPTLSEYFKRNGYYTAKMDGDWRSIYSYGYTRGIDQYIYQIQSMGSRAEQEIINVIEHLETFRETDQYLWMCVGDLHDIADEMDLSLAVQKNLTLEERSYEEHGLTSVKQKESKKKKKMYKKTATYFDMLFGLLFSYIENHFNDDEILISLFADHGQGYMVPKNNHFLSKERTKVAFMFRGNNVLQQVSDEIISTADYLPIMCHLAGIKLDNVHIDGNLPKTFGGKTQREYTISESLHPGDNYSAVANTKDYEIYFDNNEIIDQEGRFRLKDYHTYGYYHNGKTIEDQELLTKYEKIFLDRIAERIIYND